MLGNEHMIGPALIWLGQPILDKRFVMKGALAGTSIASKALSKIIPQTFTNTLGRGAGTKVATAIGTNVIGRGLGRWIPYAGWALTAYDVIDNWDVIGEFLDGIRESNERNRHRKDGPWSSEWVK